MQNTFWIPLRLSRAPNTIPQLMINTSFRASGYTVLLTDLSHVWCENLDRREICRRALNSDTPIDPSEDYKQLSIFLGKIEGALKNEMHSQCQLVPGNDTELVLEITAHLPPPLDPLKWKLHLQLRDPETLKHHFILPLLRTNYLQRARLTALVSSLHDKDHVISKLLDRLEASGIDISSVFPSASSTKAPRRSNQREQATHHVRGLAKFDEQQWRESPLCDTRSAPVTDMVELLAYATDLTVMKVGVQDTAIQDENAWWNSLGTYLSDNTTNPRYDATSSNLPSVNLDKRNMDDMEDESLTEDDATADFQKQPTPPEFRQRKNLGGNSTSLAPTEDEEVMHEGDIDLDDIQYSKSSPNVSCTSNDLQQDASKVATDTNTIIHSVKPKKKLGSIGGVKYSTTNSVPEQDKKIQDSMVDDMSDQSKKSPNTNIGLSTIRKGRLGVIGGQKNRLASDAHSNLPPENQDGSCPKPDSEHSVQNRRTELATSPLSTGTDRSSANITGLPSLLRNPLTEVAAIGQSNISPEEQANRKREELKAQLEAKSQAPVKKKRRF